ncbi:MAG: hypothetical protein AB7S65_00265 [Sulfuricurvum sp.]
MENSITESKETVAIRLKEYVDDNLDRPFALYVYEEIVFLFTRPFLCRYNKSNFIDAIPEQNKLAESIQIYFDDEFGIKFPIDITIEIVKIISYWSHPENGY